LYRFHDISVFCTIALLLRAGAAYGAPWEQPLEIQECLGYGWDSDLVHQTVTVPAPAGLRADAAVLELDGKPVPMQFDNLQADDQGRILKADVWFRTDLPAHGSRKFVLRSGRGSAETDLKLLQDGDVVEIRNALTAVRLPATGTSLVGPLLGVKLASGRWAAASQITTDAALSSCTTEVVAQGPIFIRTRTTCRFANGGNYVVQVTLRSREPLVRVDERYENAGTLRIDLGTNLQPARFATKKDFRGNMQLTPIAYDKSQKLPSLVGWDFYLPDRTSVLGLLGGPSDDLLGWVATENSPADWLPEPYRQTFTVSAGPGGTLRAEGSLERGRRTWALLVGQGATLPGGKELYRWWTKHIVVPLDKVVDWGLVWPEMDKIEFPHTFFSKADLPAIRQRLRAEPAIRQFMEELRDKGHYWGSMGSDWTPEQRQQYQQYQARYRGRKGIAKGISYLGAAYLYFADPVYLEQLNDRKLPWNLGHLTPAAYLDYFIRCYLDGEGMLVPERPAPMANMHVSDALLQRYISMEFLLGSDLLSPEEKRAILTKLAFVVYVMHDPAWQPPVHMPDGSRPEGYGQGTPNQKHCAISCRAITACMLENHPHKQAWMRFAMDELRPHYEYTIHTSGALLESPFYSSRDTIRYAPFWSAMTRAGVARIAPDYEQWMNRPKQAFVYLCDMLTPREPRMGGRRVYHPIGRSGPGVIDPTFMIGGDPWGLNDPHHASLMRWAWEQQGRPSPDCMGTTGGRDLALTLIAFSRPAAPLKANPLRSKRYEGMGAVLRSNSGSDHESNVLWRHDGFCWDLYAVNNGALYFYGKGAPLLPRFGAYWNHWDWKMDLPFGNRVEFAAGDNRCFGSTTEFADLGCVADLVTGITDDKHWRRTVLFSKDADRADLVYLLVRDDVCRPGTASFVNWWFMTASVAPDGLTRPGVVPVKTSDKGPDWVANLGKNWKDAPRLAGQYHHFPGMCGVDVDLFIATPRDPQIVTDASSAGHFPYCQGDRNLFETQQLVRIAQPPGKGYLTLLVPRWPKSPQPAYRTIADGTGVAIQHPGGEDLLFLDQQVASYRDAAVDYQARAGFVRRAAEKPLRLMVTEGRIAADGLTLACTGSAALVVGQHEVQVFHTGDRKEVRVALPDGIQKWPVSFHGQEEGSGQRDGDASVDH